MTKSLLDTDILTEVLKRRNQRVVQRATSYRSSFGVYTISTLLIVEVVKGFRKVQDENRIQQFLIQIQSVEVLTLDVLSAELAGRIFADLEHTGQTIGRVDPMIAAIALQHGLTLVTGNTAHYQRIQALGYNLQLDNWRV